MKPRLISPLKDTFVTQPFGVNWVDFYTKLGMKGHGGIDLRARRGMPVYACHNGIVTFGGVDGTGGVSVTICRTRAGLGYKTIYYHLSENIVGPGKLIKQGEILGYAGNTGKHTTGNHLHLGMKWIRDGKTLNWDNGYKGGINPDMYMENNWDKSNTYNRYGRDKQWFAEFKMRFKNPWLHRKLNKLGLIKKVYNTEFINALVYGGWDVDAVLNPAMYEVWAYLKKSEYKEGIKPFGKLRVK